MRSLISTGHIFAGWLPWLDGNRAVADTRAHLQRCREQEENGTGLVTAITEDGRIIGMLGYNEIDTANRGGFIGYWPSESHLGRGIMTISCRARVAWRFENPNLNRQRINAAVENQASRAITERLGFLLEGIEREAEWLHDHFVDHAYYSILARE